MTQRTVTVWGERYELTVQNDANGLWIAAGTYKHQKVEVKDKSENAALTRWQNMARMMGKP